MEIDEQPSDMEQREYGDRFYDAKREELERFTARLLMEQDPPPA